MCGKVFESDLFSVFSLCKKFADIYQLKSATASAASAACASTGAAVLVLVLVLLLC